MVWKKKCHVLFTYEEYLPFFPSVPAQRAPILHLVELHQQRTVHSL